MCIKTHSLRYLNRFLPLTGNGFSGRETEIKQISWRVLWDYFLYCCNMPTGLLLLGDTADTKQIFSPQKQQACQKTDWNQAKTGGRAAEQTAGWDWSCLGIGKNQFKCVNISGLTTLPGLKKPNQFHLHMKIECFGKHEAWVATELWAAAPEDHGGSSQSRHAGKMAHLCRGVSFHVNFAAVLRDHFYNHKANLKWRTLSFLELCQPVEGYKVPERY